MRRTRLLLGWLAALIGLLATAPAWAGLSVVVVLDDSGSMQTPLRGNFRVTRMEAAKEALLTVLEKLPPDAQVGILALNSRAGANGHWVYPLAAIDLPKLRAAVERIRANGMTPLGNRLKDGADAILARRAKQHYGTYRLLVVTDGEATDKPQLDRYLPDVLARGIWMDVIGVDMAQGHSLATRVHTYREADDPASLEKALEEVFAETTGDAGPAGESDFERIAPIPAEVATAALKALAQPSNDPIGQRKVATSPPGGAALPGGPSPPRPPVPTPFPAPPAQVSGVSVLGVICGGVCVGILLIAVLLVAVNRPRRS